jgi:hypothetical protein
MRPIWLQPPENCPKLAGMRVIGLGGTSDTIHPLPPAVQSGIVDMLQNIPGLTVECDA